MRPSASSKTGPRCFCPRNFHGTAGQKFRRLSFPKGLSLNLYGGGERLRGQGALSGGFHQPIPAAQPQRLPRRRGNVLARQHGFVTAATSRTAIFIALVPRFWRAIRGSAQQRLPSPSLKGVGQHGLRIYDRREIAAISRSPSGSILVPAMDRRPRLRFCVAKWKMFSIAIFVSGAHETRRARKEIPGLRALIEAHHQRTGSPHALAFSLARAFVAQFSFASSRIHLQESLEGVWARVFRAAVRDPVSVPTPAVLSVPASSASQYA